MANKKVYLEDENGERLNPATIVEQIDFDGEINVKQELEIIEGVISEYE